MVSVGYKDIYKRTFNADVYDCIAKDILNFNWSTMYREDNVQTQADIFYDVLLSSVEKHAPVKHLKFRNNDKPWITIKFREYISMRDEAYQCGDLPRYRKLRNLVNRLGKSLRKNHIEKKINRFGEYGGRRWWQEIKEICGLKNNTVGSFDNCQFLGQPVAVSELPDVLNKYFVNITDAVPVLCNNVTANNGLNVPDLETTVSELDVYKILDSLKVGKASLCDSINNKLLKNLADVLASPI